MYKNVLTLKQEQKMCSCLTSTASNINSYMRARKQMTQTIQGSNTESAFGLGVVTVKPN